MAMTKERIEYISQHIEAAAFEGLHYLTAIRNAGCSRYEFNKIKKNKRIKKALREHAFIFAAFWLEKQTKSTFKPKGRINNDLMLRIIDNHVVNDPFGIEENDKEKTKITIEVLD